MSQDNEPIHPSDQMRREIHNVISRYGQESDVTVYQTIGVLEIVKADLIDELDRINPGPNEDQ